MALNFFLKRKGFERKTSSCSSSRWKRNRKKSFLKRKVITWTFCSFPKTTTTTKKLQIKNKSVRNSGFRDESSAPPPPPHPQLWLGLTIVLGWRQMRVGLEVLRLRLFPPRHAGWHMSRQTIKKWLENLLKNYVNRAASTAHVPRYDYQ